MNQRERFWAKVEKTDGCWIWGGYLVREYGQHRLGGIKQPAHRCAWVLANGPIPKSRLVLHRCDNPLCVRPAHLFLGTQLDNMRDKVAKGRQANGARNGNARLTANHVRVIRHLRANTTLTRREVAGLFLIDPTTVAQIERRRTWGHITSEALA